MARTVLVSLGERSYEIQIGRNILYQLGEYLKKNPVTGTVGLVTDSTVGPLYADDIHSLLTAAGVKCVIHSMPAGEANKRLQRIEEICGTLLEGGLDRGSLLLALGGGVVGDVAGFAAACFMRGIPFLQIPTTVVAQVDSSVGGKTAVNHPRGKNTIGMFHQPCGVLIDMDLLKTLPTREICAGCAEIIKHGVIADSNLFAHMEQHAGLIREGDLSALEYPIARSCEIKAAVVAKDEHELGLRAILNYGHTFGHAIETASHYATFLHGEAVSLGMCAAAVLGAELGLVDADFVSRQRACLTAYSLPVYWPDLPVEEALAAMKKDKKARAGTLKFIVPTSLGTVVQRTDITDGQALRALASLKQ